MTRYVEYEDILHPREVLERWEGPSTNDHARDLRYLKDSVDTLELDLRVVKTHMARQDHVMAAIRSVGTVQMVKWGIDQSIDL